MINRCAWCVVTLALMGIVVVSSGCGKKEEPPGPAPASAPAPAADANSDVQTPAADATSQGQAVPGFDSRVFLAHLDKNGDSKITREEYGAIWKDQGVAERNFKMIDRNGDGVLSGDEFVPKGATK